jgi:hypothetical protein
VPSNQTQAISEEEKEAQKNVKLEADRDDTTKSMELFQTFIIYSNSIATH